VGILQRVFNGLVGEKHRKLVQFATLFHTWLHFVFQGTSSSVIWQIFDAWTPHFIGVHYIAHKTNLAIQILLHLQMIIKLEGLIYTLYNYFSNSLERHLEFTKLVKLMETKRAKILKNGKTHWISMLSPTWHVMVEYRTLLMKMAFDAPTNEKEKANFDLFYDVYILLKIVHILPLLQSVHNLIKFSQLQNIFIFYLVVAIKVCPREIYELYTNLNTRFKSNVFEGYKDLLNVKHDSIIMCNGW